MSRYGWRPQKPDHRDYFYAPHPQTMVALPSRTRVVEDARVPIVDQLTLGSCVGNSTAAAVAIEWLKQGVSGKPFPSRLMIYYLARALEGTTGFDAGAEIRDGFKALAKTGTCFEDLWPYNVAKFTKRPPAKCYAVAQKDRALSYLALQNNNIRAMKGCLAEGYPFVFGFTVFESFESDAVTQTGIVPMPGNESAVGGHAVLAVGYDDDTRMFTVRNSWSDTWGDKGRFYMPYEYLSRSDLSSDYWTLRKIG